MRENSFYVRLCNINLRVRQTMNHIENYHQSNCHKTLTRSIVSRNREKIIQDKMHLQSTGLRIVRLRKIARCLVHNELNNCLGIILGWRVKYEASIDRAGSLTCLSFKFFVVTRTLITSAVSKTLLPRSFNKLQNHFAVKVMAEDGTLAPPRSKWNIPLLVFFKDARRVFKMDELGREILSIAFPAALALAADPIASLVDTAFIGRLGPVEIAAVGVSIAIFNQASRITIFPLVSITTSFVAEEDTVRKMNSAMQKGENLEKSSTKDGEVKELMPTEVMLENLEKGPEKNYEMKDSVPEDDSNTTGLKPTSVTSSNPEKAKVKNERRHIPSASTALVFGTILGLIQTIVLILGAKPLLGFMGVKSGSPMLTPALRYLTLRSLGAPAVLLSLALQGVFRGFKDTKTPLYATVAGDLTNIILDPILIFACHLGVTGAAISHVISQYFIFLILLWKLVKKVDLLPPSFKDLQFSRFLKNGVLLLARVIAVTFCVTLAASLAARLGTTPMAAFQICLQVWLTSSLLADGLAVAGQAILACAFAEKDYDKATAVASRVLQMGFVLGLGLAVVVGVGLHFGAKIFSSDVNVLHLISTGIPFVAATQPINSLAFVFDGVNFGASDFAYSAYSMILVAIGSIASLFLLYKSNGFVGIWFALTIYMGLRTFAGVWRMGTGTGPWRFLRGRLLP